MEERSEKGLFTLPSVGDEGTTETVLTSSPENWSMKKTREGHRRGNNCKRNKLESSDLPRNWRWVLNLRLVFSLSPIITIPFGLGELSDPCNSDKKTQIKMNERIRKQAGLNWAEISSSLD